MEISKKIVTARKKRGLTQEQLADMTNITARTVQRIESGDSIPRAFTLKTLAQALQMVHFLIPVYLLKTLGKRSVESVAFSRAIITQQIYWVIALSLIMLLSFAYNFSMVTYFQKSYLLHYVWPILAMYALNVLLIAKKLRLVKTFGIAAAAK